MGKRPPKGIFTLEMSRDGGRIKVSAFEKMSGDEKTVRPYETQEISDDNIKKLCSDVVDILNRSNRRGSIDQKTLVDLQRSGHILYDSLLTPVAKEKLNYTKTQNLIVFVDDHLVQIPWELLYDGKDFLCWKFNMGRVVRTSQKIAGHASREIGKPSRMLIIADPREDLQASYNEGISLRDELDRHIDKIEVDLKSSTVTVNSLKAVLRDYDIVHYAGHADYDIHNPSGSGFLLEDGKLTASDIMNMAGPAAMPSLVFSNACKSGHTDRWRVDEEYETEIYGLANAFLLSGVQHYIGTFWDMQDEPGRHFALDFYRELMAGQSIGAAVRRARTGLIEKFGSESVLWASYMLYGDPTFRYIDPVRTEERGDHIKKTDDTYSSFKEQGPEQAGSVRGQNAVFSLPQKGKKWIALGTFFLCAAVLAISLSLFKTGSGKIPVNPVAADNQPDRDRQEKIREQVTVLLKNYRENQAAGRRQKPDRQDTGPPTLVFLNVRGNGISDLDKEYIISKTADVLRRSGRVQVVEREILDKLLDELNLSSSELADPDKALEIGRILSARLLSTGTISREGEYWQASIRLIETETTSLRGAVTEGIETKDKDAVTEMLTSKLLENIRSEFPLKGMLVSINKDEATLNIGRKDGVSSGLRMGILSNENGVLSRVGVVEIISAEEDTSVAKVIEGNEKLAQGLVVKELL